MQHLQQIEWGLPSKDFVPAGVGRGCSPVRRACEGRRMARFKPGSPWHTNREAGERLTWRGRNFIEAFAEINHCDVVRATMFDLLAGHSLHSPFGGALQYEHLEYFHFVCGASEGSLLQVGGSAVALHAGDLWRVHRGDLRAIVHGAREGGRHLVLELVRHAGGSTGMMADDRNFAECQNKPRAAA